MENWRCPTCRAIYKGGTKCYRCQGDLGELLSILKQADELKRQAKQFLKEGRHEEALEAIQDSLFLRQNTEAENLEALIYASQGKFNKALRLIIN